MPGTEEVDLFEEADRMIGSVRNAEAAALSAVRSFVETVDSAFPDVTADGPRRKIIDSAFKMAQQLVGVSAEFAQTVVKTTSEMVTSEPHAVKPRARRGGQPARSPK